MSDRQCNHHLGLHLVHDLGVVGFGMIGRDFVDLDVGDEKMGLCGQPSQLSW